MKYIFFFCIAFVGITSTTAQNAICIDYDAAGNRVGRQVCCTSCLPPPPMGGEDRSTSLETSEQVTLKAAPNPTTGMVQLITTGFPPEAQVWVFSSSGVIVLQTTLNSGQIDIGHLPSDIYYFRVLHEKKDKTIVVEKI